MFLASAMMITVVLQAVPSPAQRLEERLKHAIARSVVEVPPEITEVSEPSLPEDEVANQGDRACNWDDAELNMDHQVPGLRMLGFELAPGERLQLSQKRNTTFLVMSLMSTATAGPMHDEINRINKQSAPRRARGIQIRNLTGAPFPVLVRINGPINIPYHMEVKREK